MFGKKKHLGVLKVLIFDMIFSIFSQKTADETNSSAVFIFFTRSQALHQQEVRWDMFLRPNATANFLLPFLPKKYR